MILHPRRDFSFRSNHVTFSRAAPFRWRGFFWPQPGFSSPILPPHAPPAGFNAGDPRRAALPHPAPLFADRRLLGDGAGSASAAWNRAKPPLSSRVPAGAENSPSAPRLAGLGVLACVLPAALIGGLVITAFTNAHQYFVAFLDLIALAAGNPRHRDRLSRLSLPAAR